MRAVGPPGVLVLLLSVLALPARAERGVLLASTVTRLAPEPSVVLVPETSGQTPLERYRAGPGHAGPYGAGTPLVLLVRSAPLGSPDTFVVSAARRDGRTVRVALERRRFTGPLAANVVTTALVEVRLGALAAGDYRVQVVETVLDFSTYEHPETASGARRGLSAGIDFQVR